MIVRLSTDRDCVADFGEWRVDRNASVRVLIHKVAGSICGCAGWICWDLEHISLLIREHRQIDETCARSASLADFRRDRSDRRWNLSAIIDRVLMNSIENGVHVAPSLCVVRRGDVAWWVDRQDHDGCQDGNNRDDEKNFNKREAFFECAKHRTG